MSTNDPINEPRQWWENQITLHPPKNDTVARTMDTVRERYRDLGYALINLLPPGPDRTVALRALKDAAQAAIGCIACNQDHYPEDG